MAGFILSGASLAAPGPSTTPAVNTRSRLEGLPLSADLQPALSAEVADPLWLLVPAVAVPRVRRRGRRHADRRAGRGRARAALALPAGSLDADAADAGARLLRRATSGSRSAVEAEPVRAHHARLAVEAGVQLQWTAQRRPAATTCSRRPTPTVPVASADAADRTGAEWQALAGVRSIDARQLFAALRRCGTPPATLTALPPEPVVPRGAAGPGRSSGSIAGSRWYETALVDPVVAEAWNPARSGVRVRGLRADVRRRGRADRRRVHRRRPRLVLAVASPPASLGAPTARDRRSRIPLGRCCPTPVEYAGKPADRFWEFEDAGVHFGAIDAGPTDLTRVLLVEFSLVYGNDWYVVPLRLPVGSLFRVTSFTVRDTFGVTTTLTRSHNVDRPAVVGLRPGRRPPLPAPDPGAGPRAARRSSRCSSPATSRPTWRGASNARCPGPPATRTSARTRPPIQAGRRGGRRPAGRRSAGLPAGQLGARPLDPVRAGRRRIPLPQRPTR